MLTSCNSTRDELVEEFCGSSSALVASVKRQPAAAETVATGQDSAGAEELSAAAPANTNQRNEARCCQLAPSGLHSSDAVAAQPDDMNYQSEDVPPYFELVDWVRTYPIFRFGGVEGTRVCTVAFRRSPARIV